MGEQNNSSDLNGQTSANYDYTLEMCIPSLGVDNGISGNPVSTSEINRNSASSVQRAIEIDDPLEKAITSIKIPHSNAEEIKEAIATPGARVGLSHSNAEPNSEQILNHLENKVQKPALDSRANFNEPTIENRLSSELNDDKKNYAEGFALQSALDISLMMSTPALLGPFILADNVDFVSSLWEYSHSEKDSESEINSSDSLNARNPVFDVLKTGSGVIDAYDRVKSDNGSFSFEEGQTDASNIINAISTIASFFVRGPKTSKLSKVINQSLNITQWTVRIEPGPKITRWTVIPTTLLYHGTGKRPAFKIVGLNKPIEGFRNSPDYLFFSKEFKTAAASADLPYDKLDTHKKTRPSSFTVIQFIIPNTLIKKLNPQTGPYGYFRDARPIIDGTETVISNTKEFNRALKSGEIKVELFPIDPQQFK